MNAARPRPLRVLLVLLAVVASLACSREPSGPSVVLKGERFAVEIAKTPAKQRIGLMFREELARDAGMLFVFPRSAPRGFWMKNCKTSLDILYFDADLQLVNHYDSLPPCKTDVCETYPSRAPARYVLELSAGSAKRLGVAPGDTLELDLGPH